MIEEGSSSSECYRGLRERGLMAWAGMMAEQLERRAWAWELTDCREYRRKHWGWCPHFWCF